MRSICVRRWSSISSPPPPSPPLPRGEGGSAVTPLAAGRWFITNKDYPGNGTFCPFGSTAESSSARTWRALTHASACFRPLLRPISPRDCRKGERESVSGGGGGGTLPAREIPGRDIVGMRIRARSTDSTTTE